MRPDDDASWGRRRKRVRCASIAELVFGTFLDETVPVGIEQFFQLFYLDFQFGTLVGVPHHHTLGAHFHDLRGAHDVRPVFDGLFGRCEPQSWWNGYHGLP